MTVQLNPYLHFDTSARAALEFYQSVLGGDLQIMTFGDMGSPGPVPPPEGVMHGQLQTADGFVLMASDGDPERPTEAGGQVSVSISGDESAKIEGWFSALAEGGVVDVPFEKQMWGDHFGQVTDRFGIRWLLNAAG
ncbi:MULTISPECIES: VOC family protein [Pseudonocardia]|uniref:PhnB protein n=1 Tax=Pseudonocardia oroxyli TaxID=366584 RepID=A0A1G7KJ01_PSEOR|nr:MULTISPECIES: VOC family protein [Pseudonocardia]MCF7550181.1 VOC family protein [Pseudonocardia sp. WMMC193]SDF37106.1 PhnB protein [Pseudonocardia oroxyli]